VICFEHEKVCAAQVVADGYRQIAQVNGNANANAVSFKTEAHGIGCIVRNAEAVDFDIADFKRCARLKCLELRHGLSPVNEWSSEASQVDLGPALLIPCEYRKTGDVVGMLVSNENCVEPFNLLPDTSQAAADLSQAQTGVEKNAGVFRRK